MQCRYLVSSLYIYVLEGCGGRTILVEIKIDSLQYLGLSMAWNLNEELTLTLFYGVEGRSRHIYLDTCLKLWEEITSDKETLHLFTFPSPAGL